MSYRTWTADALRSNFRPLAGISWRVVEAQNRVSTLKLVDTLEEQQRLEELLEDKKPPYPLELKDYHYLLFTPFRYAPYGRGSRFRRRDQKDGVYYAAEDVATAMAEMAFFRLLFFYESPDTSIPDNPFEFTAFNVKYKTANGLDLTLEPLVRDQKHWLDKDSYDACQYLADQARAAGADILRNQSVRCPSGGKNIALISWRGFASKEPGGHQTWHLSIKPDEVVAVCEFPKQNIIFVRARMEDDPRIRQLQRQKIEKLSE